MMPRFAAVLALAMVALATAATPASADERFRWWLDAEVARHLNLSSSQAARLDQIFRESLDERRRLRTAADQAQRDMDAALAAADEVRCTALIPRLANAQIARGRARTLMVWRMFRTLTEEQRARLADIQRTARGDNGGNQAVRTTSVDGVRTPR